MVHVAPDCLLLGLLGALGLILGGRCGVLVDKCELLFDFRLSSDFLKFKLSLLDPQRLHHLLQVAFEPFFLLAPFALPR